LLNVKNTVSQKRVVRSSSQSVDFSKEKLHNFKGLQEIATFFYLQNFTSLFDN